MLHAHRLPPNLRWRIGSLRRLLGQTHQYWTIRFSGAFDRAFYLATYPDVSTAGVNPILHYIRHGAREGRNPSCSFDTLHYLRSNQDVAALDVNPLFHYLRHGRFEGRAPLPPPDAGESPTPELAPPEGGGVHATAFEELCARLPARCADAPRVSVIVPVLDQFATTRDCLLAIARGADHTPMELIVVDDGSTDLTVAILPMLPGLRYVRQTRNEGFVGACNAGASHARGELLLFLNNDTLVRDGWLDRMVQVIEQRPDAGVVGAKLLYPDGRLQEAGCIVWRDGSAWNFGRGDDPARPEYNYLREVDYVSGAAMMVPRALFEELGGFDEHYSPCYYEDVDLAFRVRAHGRRVLYQPRAEVVHLEGITSGTDTATGPKSFQVVNERKFFERWRETLRARPRSGEQPMAAKDAVASRRALVIEPVTITPDRDAGSAMTWNLCRALVELGFHVVFVPEEDFAAVPVHTARLQDAGIECVHWPRYARPVDVLAHRGEEFDLVVLSRFATTQRWLAPVRKFCPRARVVYLTIDVHSLRERRHAELDESDARLKAAAAMEREEVELVRACDRTIVVSRFEHEWLRGLGLGDRACVLPLLCYPRYEGLPFERRHGILFIGGFRHVPNRDAVRYFVDEILPLVLEQVPEARLYVVGGDVPPELGEMQSAHVIFVGQLSAPQTFFERCRVSVAPLRFGAGIKGKVAQSVAAGLPCVSTSVGVEGMGLADGEGAVVADTPRDFALAIVRLHHEEAFWQDVAARGVEFARRSYSDEANLANVRGLLADL